MSSTSETTATGTQHADEVRDCAEALVRELTAYRRDAQLYPTEHPRVAGHITSLKESLDQFLDEHGELLFEVKREGLWWSNEPLGSSRPVEELAGILRERMIRQLRLRPGLTEQEIRRLIRVLLRPPEASINPEEARPMEHLEIVRFDHFFEASDASMMEIPGSEDSEAIWQSFSSEQIERVQSLMESKAVSGKLTTMEHLAEKGANKLDFIANFFDLLRKDVTTDWNDAEGLESRVLSALDLLSEAKSQQERFGSVSTGLVAGSPDSDLTSHLRWELLRQHLPEVIESSSPRAAEDLDFKRVEEPVELPKPTGPDPVDGVRLQLAHHFWAGNTLQEYVAVCASIVRDTTPLDFRRRIDQFRRCVQSSFKEEDDVVAFLQTTISDARWLRQDQNIAFLMEFLRCSPPGRLIEVVSGGDSRVRRALLADPPLELEPVAVKEGDGLDVFGRHLLTSCLAARDKFALDVVWELLTSNVDWSVKIDWTKVLEQVATEKSTVSAWLRNGAEEFFRPGCIPLLFHIPFELIETELFTYLSRQPKLRVRAFFDGIQRYPGPQSHGFLCMGLKFDHPEVRRALTEALVAQKGKEFLEIFEILLIRNNEIELLSDEVEILCRGVSDCCGSSGREYLQRICREKKGLRRRWRRAIRKAAKAALGSSGGST